MTKEERLAALHGEPTRWEVVAVPKAGDRRFLVGYTARRSRRGLLAVLQLKGEEIVEAFGINDRAASFGKGTGAITFGCDEKFGGLVTFRFGWTERTAIQSGEHQSMEEVR